MDDDGVLGWLREWDPDGYCPAPERPVTHSDSNGRDTPPGLSSNGPSVPPGNSLDSLSVPSVRSSDALPPSSEPRRSSNRPPGLSSNTPSGPSIRPPGLPSNTLPGLPVHPSNRPPELPVPPFNGPSTTPGLSPPHWVPFKTNNSIIWGVVLGPKPDPERTFHVMTSDRSGSMEEFDQLLVPGVTFRICSWDNFRLRQYLDNLAQGPSRKAPRPVIELLGLCPRHIIVHQQESLSQSRYRDAYGEYQVREWVRPADVTFGLPACLEGLRRFGAVTRIGVVLIGHEWMPAIHPYMAASGYEVVENVHFPGTIPSGYLVNTLRRLVETKKWEQRSLDAILILEAQGNTAWVAARMERELLIPIITQTVASVWAAYRSNGIHDRICGMGWLLERF